MADNTIQYDSSEGLAFFWENLRSAPAAKGYGNADHYDSPDDDGNFSRKKA